MVLAQREHLDILDDNQLIVIFMENSTVDEIPNILLVSLCEVKHSLGVSLGRLPQSFSLRVLSDAFQNSSHSTGQLLDALFVLLGG